MPPTPSCPTHRLAPIPPAAWRGCGIGLWLLLCAGAAAAQVSTQRMPERAVAASPGRDDTVAVALAYEVTTQRSRVLAPRGARVSNDLAAVTYRVWRSHGRADLGLGIRTQGYLMPSADAHAGADSRQALVGALPALSLGLRVRVTDEHALLADAYRTRGTAAGAAAAASAGYGTKLGVEWRPAKTTLGLEHGALGMQLESGYRLSLKVRHGGPSVYLRSQF